MRIAKLTTGIAFVSALLGGVSAHAAVTISTAATANMSCAGGVCSPTAADAVLNVSDLETLLASGDVTVTTTGSGVQADDIIVSSALTWTNASSLSLDAYHSIAFEQSVFVNGAGSVSLETNDGGKKGTLSFLYGGTLSFASTSDSLMIDGKAYTLENNLPTLAAAIKQKPSGFYALSAPYDASGDGDYKTSPITTKFKGTFNGLGNAISNLTIDAFNKNAGLFSFVDVNGTINSINVAGASLMAQDERSKGGALAGIVAALNYGNIFNTFASGGLVATDGKYSVSVGGLVGTNFGTVLDSSTSVNIVVAEGKIVPEVAVAGGLAGYNDGSVERSSATGSVSVNGQTLEGTAGGLIGGNETAASVSDCYAEGAVSIQSSIYAGGLVGITSSIIKDSYSTGDSSGGSGSDVGGFVGYDGSDGGLSNDYWDLTTSGIDNTSEGAGNIANDPGIKGLSDAKLKAGLPKGFDKTVWAQDAGINNGYPYLIANPPQ